MISSSPGRSVSVWLAVAVIGAPLGHVGLTKLSADPPPPHAAGPFPMSARIARTSISRHRRNTEPAAARSTPRGARLDSSLRNAKPQPTRPAVVMDLDETVLDNSAFQTFLYNHHLEYTDKLWADYEQNDPQDVTLIPGAKHFIDRAESLGVNVVFISNRSDEYRTLTKRALQRLLGSDPTRPIDRLYLRSKDGNSDKSSRRDAVAAKFNVLMYFGDNLRDFSDVFAAAKLPQNPTPQECLEAIDVRQSAADDASCHWGVDWFVIPNPVYGEWEKLIGPDPEAIMHSTSLKAKGGRDETDGDNWLDGNRRDCDNAVESRLRRFCESALSDQLQATSGAHVLKRTGRKIPPAPCQLSSAPR